MSNVAQRLEGGGGLLNGLCRNCCACPEWPRQRLATHGVILGCFESKCLHRARTRSYLDLERCTSTWHEGTTDASNRITPRILEASDYFWRYIGNRRHARGSSRRQPGRGGRVGGDRCQW